MLDLIADYDLSAHNTFGLAARTRFAAVITDRDQLPALYAEAKARGLPVRILGGGSNVVLADHFDGITALMAIKGREMVEDNAERTIIEAGAGEIWHDLVTHTVEAGHPGLENLALIPGTVGAAPVQNIGAYGVELVERFDSLVAYDRLKNTFATFSREMCSFSYRDSVFKHMRGRYIVVSVRLALPKPWAPITSYPGLSDADPTDPKSIMAAVIAQRQSKLPDWRVTGNAGSFFHNPIVSADTAATLKSTYPSAPAFPQADERVKLSAGWLIDNAGLKGFRMGPVGVSDRHALVLVNHGGGTQADISALAEHIKSVVSEKFGVTLVAEPEFI